MACVIVHLAVPTQMEEPLVSNYKVLMLICRSVVVRGETFCDQQVGKLSLVTRLHKISSGTADLLPPMSSLSQNFLQCIDTVSVLAACMRLLLVFEPNQHGEKQMSLYAKIKSAEDASAS